MATTLVQRYGKALDQRGGGLTHLCPEPAVLAGAEPAGGLGALAAARADGVVRLDPGADRTGAEAAPRALPGMPPRVVAEIRARALGDPDVAAPGLDVPKEWRPWRTYAVRHLLTEAERARQQTPGTARAPVPAVRRSGSPPVPAVRRSGSPPVPAVRRSG
ncbi:hypothetical protein ACIRQ9_30850, partial [Streptomyces sp. NPDC101237]